MTASLDALCIDANDPSRLARFWAGVLGWEPVDDTTLLPSDDTGFRIRFLATDEPKVDAVAMADPDGNEFCLLRPR